MDAYTNDVVTHDYLMQCCVCAFAEVRTTHALIPTLDVGWCATSEHGGCPGEHKESVCLGLARAPVPG